MYTRVCAWHLESACLHRLFGDVWSAKQHILTARLLREEATLYGAPMEVLYRVSARVYADERKRIARNAVIMSQFWI